MPVLHALDSTVPMTEPTASAYAAALSTHPALGAWRLDSHLHSSPVAAGQAEWRGVLADFWQPFDATVQAAMDVSVMQVIDELDALLEPMLFPIRQVSLLTCLKFPC